MKDSYIPFLNSIKRFIPITRIFTDDLHTLTYGTDAADANNNKLAMGYTFDFSTKAIVLAIAMDENIKANLYPNPARNNVTINAPQGDLENAHIQIFDLSGKAIFPKMNRTPKSEIKIDISAIKKGLYIVRLNSNSFNYVGKLIVD